VTVPNEKMNGENSTIWPDLQGGVWHTTRPDRFLSILDAGAVLTDPPNADHSGTFAQSLGGISLFDFRNFDPVKYEVTNSISSWKSFVPYQYKSAGAVWLEVDLERIGEALISAEELIEKWHEAKAKPNILPRLEAAHIGDLPLSNIRRVIFIRARAEDDFRKFDIEPFDRAAYEALLPEWRKGYEFAKLPLAEQMKLRPPDFSNAPHNPDLTERMAEAEKRLEKYKGSEK